MGEDAGEAIDLLRSGEVSEISLDHDLSLSTDEGQELALKQDR
jgi:hypothetical protein